MRLLKDIHAMFHIAAKLTATRFAIINTTDSMPALLVIQEVKHDLVQRHVLPFY